MNKNSPKPVVADTTFVQPNGRLLINGKWLEGDAEFPVSNPATGEVFASVSSAGEREALLALDAAEAAKEGWRNVAPRQRAELMHRLYDLMLTRQEDFARVMTLESGKPLTEARAEFKLSCDFLRWFAEQTAHLHGSYAPASNGGFRIMVAKQPIGPCLLITPWNFPLLMIVRKGGAALAAGCTMVVKSAQETPLTCALFAELVQEAGFPDGVMNLIHTTNSASVSTPLMNDKRIRKVSFTGSTRVGGLLMELAAKNITKCSLELGGDGPFVVLDDADIDLAVEQAVICKFRNAGQACVAANRIIVDKKVEKEFTEKFLKEVEALTVGDGMTSVDVGPMISARQRDRLGDTIRSLEAAGGTVVTGGAAVEGPGYFFQPTVIRFDAPNEVMCSNELFAPVATIFPVENAAEALAFANKSDFGLASYVFTKDVSRALTFGERLEFGMVGINRGIMADAAAPFGGTKASGIGREGGQEGIYEFMEDKYIALTVNEAQGVA
ncbi:NAD-dependent succinate-semialdehyde dehydrogenase [Celeribacter sp.]|uniref:NAD-dependent succinate-semialdehyde dehydrogenase n=1 Tax=Celeribacter sp. TaxID=1890673 RepID=UPI003A924EDF